MEMSTRTSIRRPPSSSLQGDGRIASCEVALVPNGTEVRTLLKGNASASPGVLGEAALAHRPRLKGCAALVRDGCERVRG